MPVVVIRGPGGTMPYGPLALTVLRGPGGLRGYRPFALTVPRGPAAIAGYEPRAASDGLVAGDAPATAGIARHSVQAPVVMRRISMAGLTSRGLENCGRVFVAKAKDARMAFDGGAGEAASWFRYSARAAVRSRRSSSRRRRLGAGLHSRCRRNPP